MCPGRDRRGPRLLPSVRTSIPRTVDSNLSNNSAAAAGRRARSPATKAASSSADTGRATSDGDFARASECCLACNGTMSSPSFISDAGGRRGLLKPPLMSQNMSIGWSRARVACWSTSAPLALRFFPTSPICRHVREERGIDAPSTSGSPAMTRTSSSMRMPRTSANCASASRRARSRKGAVIARLSRMAGTGRTPARVRAISEVLFKLRREAAPLGDASLICRKAVSAYRSARKRAFCSSKSMDGLKFGSIVPAKRLGATSEGPSRRYATFHRAVAVWFGLVLAAILGEVLLRVGREHRRQGCRRSSPTATTRTTTSTESTTRIGGSV